MPTGHCRGGEPDGTRAVSASDDKTLKVWDLATGGVVATFAADYPLQCCASSPRAETLVAGDIVGASPSPAIGGTWFGDITQVKGGSGVRRIRGLGGRGLGGQTHKYYISRFSYPSPSVGPVKSTADRGTSALNPRNS